jgi:lysophospholipase L1-like esterase
MKRLAAFFLCLITFLSHNACSEKPKFTKMDNQYLTFLALGDSYTIGESVAEQERWPNQLVKLFEKSNVKYAPPTIIAKTGWTTDELEQAISASTLNNRYDLVSLLIGVNNQYRGLSQLDYQIEFERLLKKAIELAGNQTQQVVVVSIPDWGVTPFAEGRDRNKIANEIDAFNLINRKMSDKYHVHYVEITEHSRNAATDLSLIAEDKLHPSGKMYQHWATQVFKKISNQ